MDYALKSATSRQVPYTNKKGEYGIDVLVTTGIVNQNYSGFENIDLIFCVVEKTDSVNGIETKINESARVFVASKYKHTA